MRFHREKILKNEKYFDIKTINELVLEIYLKMTPLYNMENDEIKNNSNSKFFTFSKKGEEIIIKF